MKDKSILKLMLPVMFVLLFSNSFGQGACVPTDLTSTGVTAHTATLSWAGISGPTHIRYYVAGTNFYKYMFVNGTTATLHMLLPETNYVWDLNNLCNGIWTPYTGNATFTTLADTTVTCVPSNLQASEITSHTARLSWEGIFGPTRVRYYVEGTNFYKYKFVNGTSVLLKFLIPETNYIWDLSNFCNGIWTPYTGNASFTTLADSTLNCEPTNLSSSNITATSATLSWENFTGPAHIRYFPVGSSQCRMAFTFTSSVILQNLLPGTDYEWQLSVKCGLIWLPFSPSNYFTTLPDSSGTSVMTAESQKSSGNIFNTEQNFTVYPNPVNQISKVAFNTEEQEKYVLSISDLSGKEISQIEGMTEKGFNELDIDFSEFKDGIYFLVFRSETINKSLKLVKN